MNTTQYLSILLFGNVLMPTAVAAQSYPTRPIRIIAQFTPGTSTDIMARITAQHLSRVFGQQVIVDNRPGAGAVLGTEIAAKATPDGHTLVTALSSAFGINPTLYARIPYDAVKDFEPIANLVLTPQTLVASPSAPFKGSGEAHPQIMGGQIPVMCDAIPATMPHIKAGKLRGLGIATLKRSPFLPDLPTIAEQGFAGFEAVGWIGLAAPAKTPAAVLDRLNTELNKMLGDAEVKERLNTLAFTPVGSTRKEFADYIKSEIAKWGKAVKESGARVD